MLSYTQVYLWASIALTCYHQTPGHAQIVGFGSCPDKKAVTDFKLKDYVGKWFENRKYVSDYEVGQHCVSVEFKSNSDGEMIVENTGTQKITGRKIVRKGIARQINAPSGKFAVSFPEHTLADNDAPYWVLGTDYTSYSVIWSCIIRGPIYLHTLWIHTRDSNPSSDTINKALDVVSQNNLSRRKLRLTRRQNC